MPEAIREVVAAFDDTNALDDAVYALETRGFDRAAFSLLANERAVEEKLGHRYQNVKEVEDDPNVPRATFFSRISRLEADYLPARRCQTNANCSLLDALIPWSATPQAATFCHSAKAAERRCL